MTRKPDPTRPATPNQLNYLTDLGFRDTKGWTFDRAHLTLDRVASIRQYAQRVAHQAWGQDIFGFDVRPIIVATMGDEVMAQTIHALMEEHFRIAFECQAREDAANGSNRRYQQQHYAVFLPRLPEDEYYRRVRAGLGALLRPRKMAAVDSLWRRFCRLFNW